MYVLGLMHNGYFADRFIEILKSWMKIPLHVLSVTWRMVGPPLELWTAQYRVALARNKWYLFHRQAGSEGRVEKLLYSRHILLKICQL